MDNTKTKKILVLYASIGSGHKMAAYTVKESIENKRIKVELIDILTLSKANLASPLKSFDYRNNITGPIYDLLWKNRFLARISSESFVFLKENFQELFTKIKAFAPGLIICTHNLCSMLVTEYKKNKSIHSKHVVILTDFRAHAFWSDSEVDLYCASTYAAKIDLITKGISPEKIVVTGIPLRKQFLNKRISNKKKGGLRFLIIGGSIESAPYSQVSKQIYNMVKIVDKFGFSSTVICGSNSDLRDILLKKLQKDIFNSNHKILGFENDLAKIFNECDLVITKPGGLICSEAIALEKPMILIGTNYGQEKANEDYLINSGVAIKAENIQKLTGIIPKISNVSLINEMVENIKKIQTTNFSKETIDFTNLTK